MKTVLGIANFIRFSAKAKRQFRQFVEELDEDIIPNYINNYCIARWLSTSNGVKRFVDLIEPICTIFEKGKIYVHLGDFEWNQELMVITDVMDHIQFVEELDEDIIPNYINNYCIARWLSTSNGVKRFVDLIEPICTIFEKGKIYVHLGDFEWNQELMVITDVMDHIQFVEELDEDIIPNYINNYCIARWLSTSNGVKRFVDLIEPICTIF